MKEFIYIIFLILFYPTGVLSQISNCTFFTDFEKIEIPVNQTFEVVYILEKKGDLPDELDVKFPKWNGLKNLGNPQTNKGTKFINGNRSSSLTKIFQFKAPSDTGTYIFPPATFNFRDSIVKSNPLKVIVIPMSDSLRANQIYIRAELHPTKAMVGELVRLDLRVYGLYLPMISGCNLVDELQFEGIRFANSPYREHDRRENIMVDGKMYDSYLAASFPIYANYEGRFEIPSFSVELSIKKEKPRANFFNSFRREFVKTQPVELEIFGMDEKDNPYPPLNGRGVFFEVIDTALHKGQIKLEVTLTGLGDPLFYAPPKIGLEKVAKIQLEKVMERMTRFPKEANNSKIFSYTINFLEKGEFKIQPEWITWDTEQQTWDTIYAKPQKIIVPSIAVNVFPKNKNEEVIESKPQSPHDIIFAIDISSTMLTQDISPSRIDFVKEQIKHFIKNESGLRRYGIVLFAGKSKLIFPLTSKVEEVIKAFDLIKVGQLDAGTAIGDGLMNSLKVLCRSKAPKRTIILLTDGDQNTGKFNPLLSAKIARQEGIQINSFVIGSNDDQVKAPIRRKANGEYIYGITTNSRVKNEEIFKTLSSKTNGIYFRILEPNSIDQSLKEALNFRTMEIPGTEPSIDQRLLDIYFKRFN